MSDSSHSRQRRALREPTETDGERVQGGDSSVTEEHMQWEMLGDCSNEVKKASAKRYSYITKLCVLPMKGHCPILGQRP